MNQIGRIFIILGIALLGTGLLLNFSDRIPFLGKLPGDFEVRRENFRFFFPLTTSILISLLLNFIFWIISFLPKK